jgi:hypothetical protein
VLDGPMWHTGRILSEDSALGDVLHSFFGYSDSPTPLQLIVYVTYLAIVMAAFLGLWGARHSRKAAEPAAADSGGPGVPGADADHRPAAPSPRPQ